MLLKTDEYFMSLALKEARKAYALDEVPVGCVIVASGEVIARAYNRRQENHDPLGHAEIRAIKRACKKREAWILDDCVLYVTLEPCLMCAGAILQTRIKKVIFGTFEPKFGVLGSVMDVYKDGIFNHEIEVKSGVMDAECSALLKDFFKKKRSK
jgi:tRNA(adenine34) deaminase